MISEKFKTIKYEDLFGIGENDVKRAIDRSCPGTSGVYLYILRKETVKYPFGSSRIVYIGKSRNLKKRIKHHFTSDMKSKLFGCDEVETLEWPYQNYFIERSSMKIDIVLEECKEYDNFELFLLGSFFKEYGAPPLCNGSVQRKKLRDVFSERSDILIDRADKLIQKIDVDIK